MLTGDGLSREYNVDSIPVRHFSVAPHQDVVCIVLTLCVIVSYSLVV